MQSRVPKSVLTALLISLAAVLVAAQAENKQKGRGGFSYPPEMQEAQAEVYKTVGDVKLRIYVFNPSGHKPTDKAPAIVFFFGGGWNNGSPQQFEQQCRYLASRGMVAMAADYRVATRQQVKAVDCVKDAKSAIRWVRQNAARLGVDPDRIAAGGGSARGHLAACAGLIEKFDEPGEDARISSRPNAMVLFNPAVVLAPIGELSLNSAARKSSPSLQQRMGVEPAEISPLHHIHPGAPPAAIFHGKADTTVPVADLTQAPGSSPLFFPHVADGDGYLSTFILLNTTNKPQSGVLRFFGDDGSPLSVRPSGGTADSSFRYAIPADGSYLFQTDGSPAAVQVGSLQLTPDPGTTTPAGAGIFNRTVKGTLVTESGIHG